MSIVLDPSKSFISIETYYIEEHKPHGNSIFHFLDKSQDFETWKNKGFKTQSEINQLAMPKTERQGPSTGVPISKQSVVFDSKKIIQKLVTTWKRMTWKDQNMIFSRCLRTVPGPDGQATTELDTIMYRDLKIKTCLKDWDLQDDNGVKVPINSDVIDSLAPEVAVALLNNFEMVTEASAEDLGELNG